MRFASDFTVRNGKVYNTNGEVAVLYSPGYGSGWSTCNRADCLFTPEVVVWVLFGMDDNHLKPDCSVLYGDMFWDGGLHQLEVAWLKPGTKFYVSEYDGSESVVREDSHCWKVA